MGQEYHAVLMRNLDEDLRNELIEGCENCYDGRDEFIRKGLKGLLIQSLDDADDYE